jgi:hypothetical protein
MHSPFVRAMSRVLIVCLSAVSFHVQAGLIGSSDAVAAAQAQAGARTALASLLVAHGIPSDSARDRVAALNDAEVAQLAGQLDSVPSGAAGGLVFGVLFVVIFLIWRFNWSDQAKAEAKSSEAAKKEPAKKQ